MGDSRDLGVLCMDVRYLYMKRLTRIKIPDIVKINGRDRELLGETKGNTMVSCVYNLIIAEGVEQFKVEALPLEKTKELCEEALLTARKAGTIDDSFKLKPYQIEDMSKLLTRANNLNINKPGYGKTLETILWIKIILKKDFKVLIICPKSVIETWHSQLKKYWPDYLDCGTWWITNYHQLYNPEIFETARSFEWDLIVLDESHKIKKMTSKITDACFRLNSINRMCLTGTPIKNRPQDLAAQLKWLDVESITNFTDFQFAFCDMRRDNWGWHAKGLTKNKSMVSNLQDLLELYCTGGKEHDIGDVDNPKYIKVRLKMYPKVKTLYNKTVGEYNEELKKKVIDTKYLLDQGVKVTSAIEAAVRLQQLASNPQLFDEKLKNIKFEWIEDWLDGTDEKVVIFSKYAKTIDQLELFLKAKNIRYERVMAAQKPIMRQAAISRWNKTDTQVLMGTFGVLKEGVDGLQDNCRYEIFIDREWTASDNDQAEGRIWRTGQKRQPIFYILQCIGSIDIRIERVQLDKGHDAKELLDPVSDDEE